MRGVRSVRLSRRSDAPHVPVTLERARKNLRALANPPKARVHRRFFKETDDVFLGVTTPQIRTLARHCEALSLTDVSKLVKSGVHDEHSLAHAILVRKFRAGDERTQTRIFRFYMSHRKHIRSWDGVDDTAPYIVGPYLLRRNKQALYELARAPRIWDRRIAVVATWWFIRQGEIKPTLKIVKMLLGDREDLIHKACGWMLREAGKRNLAALREFLRTHSARMPRTTLRYAIERMSPKERAFWLGK